MEFCSRREEHSLTFILAAEAFLRAVAIYRVCVFLSLNYPDTDAPALTYIVLLQYRTEGERDRSVHLLAASERAAASAPLDIHTHAPQSSSVCVSQG